MATTLKTLRWADLAVGISIFILAALAGCQSQPAAPTVSNLPPPSFDGPTILTKKPAAHASRPALFAPSGPAQWKPATAARAWRWIVIHHSATPTGSMAFFDKEHKSKGWDGVGYHFVIGNGTNTGDGQVEVTSRWSQQKWGAHAKTADNRFNEQGVGICLVGNFDLERPSTKQMQSLSRLVSYLMQTYGISAQNVVGHRDTKPTDCPGKYMSLAAVRSSALAATAQSPGRRASAVPSASASPPGPTGLGSSIGSPAAQTAAGTELLTELGR